MSRGATLIALALACAAGCDGLGRAVVGRVPISEGGAHEPCDVTPQCVPVDTPPAGTFTVGPELLVPMRFSDCDGDGVPDAQDPCPGVPDTEGPCDAARAACDLLRSGASDLSGRDLRGCRTDAPLTVPADLSLANANLSCADLSLTSAGSTQVATLDLQSARIEHAALVLSSAGAWIADVSRAQLSTGFIELDGGARLRARDTVISNMRMVLAPSGAGAGSTAPAIEMTASDVQTTTVVEKPDVWPGRVLVQGSNVHGSLFSVGVLDLNDGSILDSRLDASTLWATGVDLESSAVRSPYAVISNGNLRTVKFAECVDLWIENVEVVEDIDVPACEPEHFRLNEVTVTDSRLAGGLVTMTAKISASVLGGGPGTAVQTHRTDLRVVTLCNLHAAAFFGGELRCVRCAPTSFMDGRNVCLSGARIVERGCQPLERAAECQ